MISDISGYVLPTKAEVINDAIMSGQAALILEGSTDIQLYRGVADQLERDVVLRPVELIAGFGEGCSEVIRLIDELEGSAELSPFLKKNIIGVIDKDVRDFRNELPQSEHVFVLKYYSVESHYVCDSVLVRCLVESTYAPQDGRLSRIAKDIYDSFPESYEALYFGSIDALRAALNVSYNADYGYADSFGRLKDASLVERLTAKGNSLSEYAHSLGLNRDIDSMKCFAKGKTLLDCYCSELKCRIDGLQEACGTGQIPPCDYCASGNTNKCCYRVKAGVTVNSLKNAVLAQLPVSEFQYLIDGLNHHLRLEAA